MTNAIKMDWLSSTEGESLLHHFYARSTNKRRFYGMLERPPLPSSIEEVSYKICMLGKSGVGKTSVIARFSGSKGNTNYVETHGIKRTNIFWPVKVWDKVVLFKLQFWDASENSIKKYSHILPMCKNKADALCYVFTFDDVASFNELPQLMNSTSASTKDNPASIIIGSRYKVWSTLAVTDAQIKEFEDKWQIKVIKIDTNKPVTRPEIFDCSYHLNCICATLWDRDQDFITKQVVQV